jgi:hypothetical protein
MAASDARIADQIRRSKMPPLKIANLSVRRGDLVGVAAMVDRLDPILGTKRLEIGDLAAAHHHAAHLTALTTLLFMSFLLIYHYSTI